jgi:hypothetical protein
MQAMPLPWRMRSRKVIEEGVLRLAEALRDKLDWLGKVRLVLFHFKFPLESPSIHLGTSPCMAPRVPVRALAVAGPLV